MSFNFYEDILELPNIGEDFQLSVLENAYRTGAMPRLTGLPSGAPVVDKEADIATAYLPPDTGSKIYHTSGMFMDEAELYPTLEPFSSNLPVDGQGSHDERQDDGVSVQDTFISRKRRNDQLELLENEEDDDFEQTHEKMAKDSNKSHTKRCREKVNDKFRQLLEELPLPPDGIEVQHKAQILDYTIKTLKDLANKKTALETELTFSSKKHLLRWVSRAVSNSKTLADAGKPFLEMFCTKKNWKYAELWLPGRPKSAKEMILNLKKYVVDRSLQSAAREKMAQFGERSQNITFNPSSGVPGRVFSTLRPEWLPKLDNNDTFLRADLARECGLRVCLAVPIVTNGHVAAVTVFFDTETRDYDADCLDLAIDIATLIGSAYFKK